LRFDQAKVHSTTQCRGIRTTPSRVSDDASAAVTVQTVPAGNRASRQAQGFKGAQAPDDAVCHPNAGREAIRSQRKAASKVIFSR